MDYNDLDRETRILIKKAIDIYDVIKDKDLKVSYKGRYDDDEETFEFKKHDKRVFSIFAAGILHGGHLGDLVKQFDDIQVDDVLEFIDTDLSEIEELQNSNDHYREMYNTIFSVELDSIIRKGSTLINNPIPLCPEKIMYCVSNSFADSESVEVYFKKYLDCDYNSHHPFVEALQAYLRNLPDKKISKQPSKPSSPKPEGKGLVKITGDPFVDMLFNHLMDLDPDADFKPNRDDDDDDDRSVVKKDIIITPFGIREIPSSNRDDGYAVTGSHKFLREMLYPGDADDEDDEEEIIEEPEETGIDWDILEDLKRKFIGQEEAAEDIFYNIVNNQELAKMKDIPDGQRSIIFMDGPSGTGKTGIVREITKQMKIPFVSTSINNYSSTGYVGGNLTDLLEQLLAAAQGDLELAQKGIIVLDEFDKIAHSQDRGLEMKRAVQQQLLDFLGGGKYTIPTSKGFMAKDVEFDTSKLTFVCLAALTDLREEKQKVGTTLGFNVNPTTPATPAGEKGTYNITPDDLIGIGLEKELVGRLNTYLHTKEYPIDILEKILRESEISPLKGFKIWVEKFGKTLDMDDDVYHTIAECAYKLNTGARSLQTIVNGIRTRFIKQVLRGDEEVIRLDSNIVREISAAATSRKARD